MGVWFLTGEVQSILEGLHHTDLSIVEVNRIPTGRAFEWGLREETEALLDRIIDREVTKEVGYSFGDASQEDRQRWIEVYEQQPSVQSVLNGRWGDPNALLGYGVLTANRMFHHNPNVVKLEDDSQPNWKRVLEQFQEGQP